MSLQAYGGDGAIQRIKRVAFDAKSTVMVSWRESISSKHVCRFETAAAIPKIKTKNGGGLSSPLGKVLRIPAFSQKFGVEAGSAPKLGFIRRASELSGELLR